MFIAEALSKGKQGKSSASILLREPFRVGFSGIGYFGVTAPERVLVNQGEQCK